MVDMTQQKLSEILVGPGEGETITRRESREVAIVTGREQLTITRSRYSPGERGADAHVHREHTDVFCVLEGEMTYGVGPDDAPVRVAAGGVVAIPPNVSHSFRNDAETDGRYLNLHAPDGGFAEYVRGARDGRSVGFDSFDPPEDGGRPAEEAVLSHPGEGEPLTVGDAQVTIKGALPHLTVAEWDLGGAFEDRLENDQVASLYVLAGVLEITLDGALHTAGPGTLASIPAESSYAFGPERDSRARMLTVHAPGGGYADRLHSASER